MPKSNESKQHILDGYTKARKQPNIKGLSLWIGKVGGSYYFKLFHEATNMIAMLGTKAPITVGLTALADNLERSPIAQIDWTLKSAEALIKKYPFITITISDFLRAVTGRQPQAFEEYFQKVSTAKKPAEYKSFAEKSITNKKIRALPKTDSCALHSVAHVFNQTVEETWPYLEPYFGKKNTLTGRPTRGMNALTLITLIRQMGYNVDIDSKYSNIAGKKTLTWGNIKEQLKAEDKPYLVMVQNHLIGVARGQIMDVGATKDNELIHVSMTVSKAGFDAVKQIKELNKKRVDPRLGVHRYSFRIGSYVGGQYKGYKDRIIKIRGILVRENSYKNNGIASGGILVKDEEGNLSVIESTHLERLFYKTPKDLQVAFDKMVREGRITKSS